VIRLNIISVINCPNDRIFSDDVGLRIKGTVNEKATPIPCRVRLFHKNTGRLLKDIATDSIGKYEFDKLLKEKYFVVAHHPASQFNAVIQDNVVPK